MVDREQELDRLVEAADNAPQLVIVRGRQRVGKSYLVERALGDRRGIFFQADEQDERGHLDLFGQEAGALLPGSPTLQFGSWDEALRFVGAQAAQAPAVLALDEFQWLWEAQRALDSILQRHWDRWQRDGVPVTVVLSGSALAKMEDLVAPGRPLHGRADYRPLLLALDYRRAAGFADPGTRPEELLRRWAVLGGTPQYQVWAGPGPIADVIAGRILSKGESLYEEPLSLLRAEQTIRTPGTYFKLCAAIAGGATQHNLIADKAQIAQSNVAKMLERMEVLGYIERRQPLTRRGFEDNRGVYRLADPFFRFWFRYVWPNRSSLERGRVKPVAERVMDDLDNFVGPVFEDCCRVWLGTYCDDPLAAGITEVGSWWARNHEPEIDVVSLRGRRYGPLGTCRWDSRADSRVLAALESDSEALLGLGADADAEMVVFARGFSRDLRSRAQREGVRLVSAAELF